MLLIYSLVLRDLVLHPTPDKVRWHSPRIESWEVEEEHLGPWDLQTASGRQSQPHQNQDEAPAVLISTQLPLLWVPVMTRNISRINVQLCHRRSSCLFWVLVTLRPGWTWPVVACRCCFHASLSWAFLMEIWQVSKSSLNLRDSFRSTI